MKHHTKALTIFPLILFLANPSITTKQKKDTSNYYELMEGVYVSDQPGFYNTSFNLSFEYDDKYEISYKTNLTDDDMVIYEKDSEIDIKKVTSKSTSDYPLTTSVDGILENYTGGKCSSDAYINNIQKTGDYVLYDKQPVVTIKVTDKETNSVVLERSLTYLIHDKITQNISIPVISLSISYDDIFGDSGFYNNIQDEISKRADMEYFDPEYNESFYRNTQIKLGGNWTMGYPQRTFNLNFNKDQNGNKNEKVTEHVFKERTKRGNSKKRLTKLTRFRLHNGGNSFESSTRINDAVLQTIMQDSYASTTGYRPCIVYINGEYWGLMSIREHYKDVYFDNNYDVDKDNVITYDYKGTWSVDEGDETVGNEKITALDNFISENDFSSDEVYNTFINEYIDINSFMDVFIAQAYCGNWDFVGNYNNLKMWTVQTTSDDSEYTDGKFRFCLHDCDFAFTSDSNPMYKYHANSYSKFNILAALLKNSQFKKDFLARAEYLINNNLSAYNCTKVLNEMVDEIRPYRDDSSLRWGQKESDLYLWNVEVNNTFKFFKSKSETFIQELTNALMMY